MAAKWEYEAFETFSKRREEIALMVYVSCYALKVLEGSTRLATVLNKTQKELDHAKTMENMALKEAENDFPLMHSTGTMLLWAALESTIRDMLVRWLVKNPRALQAKEVTNLKVRLGEYELLEGEDRMRYVVGQVEKDVGSALQPGIGRFTGLLRVFGIVPKCDEALKRDLLEMASLRHCIAHRAGSADRKLVDSCPWLKLKENDPIRISRSDFLRYLRAVSDYGLNTVEAAKGASSILSAS